MPYIDRKSRMKIDPKIEELSKAVTSLGPKILGNLNYSITQLVRWTANPSSYADYASLVGMLETMKLEFYRRAVAAYEDEKIKENGDVY